MKNSKNPIKDVERAVKQYYRDHLRYALKEEAISKYYWEERWEEDEKEMRESEEKKEKTKYFMVPFEHAMDIVNRHTEALVHKGVAYILRDHLPMLLQSIFRKQLIDELTLWRHNPKHLKVPFYVDYLERNPYMKIIVLKLRDLINKKEIKWEIQYEQEDKTPEALVKLGVQSFPMCMADISAYLVNYQYIRHYSRFQLILFLKASGLKELDIVNYFDRLYSRSPTKGRYRDEMNYHIRHIYGLKGQLLSYNPYACKSLEKLEMGGRQEAELHGCPFHYMSEEDLQKNLEEKDCLGDQDIEDILKATNKGDYAVIQND